ncbi:hypothetical protein [Pseudobutyrivibrio xylanivorans]|uniref:Uncharacterized protein n=1 Tax=Pseudobutyrivibrio xylanivorans TaxID=185007 RepID=A0A5P6VP22_PSEXY|nr:hypothetical protein [Pseudobutyrivibrio xylanivorans]QFJ54415.1 hypothetical protein FXF36_05860 [Pseudobutyrivibrio xylanivorans]
MNISGIRPSVGFYENNPIKNIPPVNQVPVEEKQASFGSEPAAVVEISEVGLAASKHQVAKAVSNMEQDKAIHRYQYFVQSKPAVENTTVRGSENFVL